MPNYLLYHAVTRDELYQCAWSLLKYLSTYNLKPPPDQQLVIHASQPAFVEAYCVFFQEYEMLQPATTSAIETIHKFCQAREGNLLYFGASAYPVVPLEPVFDAIEHGALYSALASGRKNGAAQSQISVLGLNTRQHHFDQINVHSGKPVDDFAEQCSDVKDFNLLLRSFFERYGEESVPRLVKLASYIDINRIRQERLHFERLPLLIRITRKLTGRGWNIASYIR